MNDPVIPEIPVLPINDDTRTLEVEVRWGHTLVQVARYREETEVIAGEGGLMGEPFVQGDRVLASREGTTWFAFDGESLVDDEERVVAGETHSYTLRIVSRSVEIALPPLADLPMANSFVTSAAATFAFVAALLLVPISSHATVILDPSINRSWVISTAASTVPKMPDFLKPSNATSGQRNGTRNPGRASGPVDVNSVLGAIQEGFQRETGARSLHAGLANALKGVSSGPRHGGNLLGKGGAPGGTYGVDSVGIGSGTRIGCSTCTGTGTGTVGGGPKFSEPTVSKGPAAAIGSLDKEIIRRIVRANHDGVRHCYERALQGTPGLKGRVLMRFIIAPTGKVRSARAVEDTIGHSVGTCLEKRIKRWRFPKPEGGGIVVTSYPFVFRS